MNGIRFTLAAGAAAAIALASFSAHADEQRGLAVGVRTGVGLPLGTAYSTPDTSLATFTGAMLPFWFDLGYRIDPNWYVGAWYQFGVTRPSGSYCTAGSGTSGSSCDGSDQRFGLNAHYHIMPTQTVDPWVGLGIGYETTRVNFELPSATEVSNVASGFQFLDLQLGADLRFAEKIPFGPWLDFSLGKYSSYSRRDFNANSVSVDGGGGMHEWLTLGIRGQFNL
jgi:hypothetical protein